jgi:hypothetical protein
MKISLSKRGSCKPPEGLLLPDVHAPDKAVGRSGNNWILIETPQTTLIVIRLSRREKEGHLTG